MVSIGSIGHDTIPMEKVHVLFVGDFEKVNLCWMRGQKVAPMVFIGSIGDEPIPMEKSMFYL